MHDKSASGALLNSERVHTNVSLAAYWLVVLSGYLHYLTHSDRCARRRFCLGFRHFATPEKRARKF